MRIYNSLSSIPFIRKKFSTKFLLVAFLGIHVPIIGLVTYLMTATHALSVLRIILIVLTFTLASTIVTLYILEKLLSPLVKAKKSLDDYLISGQLPNLPVHYEDEVGLLLKNVQVTIEKFDELLTEKSDLVDLLSHDLRSPISRIISLSNLIDIDKECEPQVYTGLIVQESQNLLALLEDVLGMLKKADGNEVIFNLVPTSLKNSITKTVSFYEHITNEKAIKYHINIKDDLIVNIEPVMFTQAIKNLLSNALKYSDPGKNIYITSIAESKKFILTIKDEGIGFDPKNKEKIFDRFTRASKKGTRGESSTGLGLSLARKIIEKHGGQLLASSEGPGRGATFTIILPRNNGKTPLSKGFRFIKGANPLKRAI